MLFSTLAEARSGIAAVVMTMVPVKAVAQESAAVNDPSSTLNICGQLEDGTFVDDEGLTYAVSTASTTSSLDIAGWARFKDALNARFVGNRVCLANVTVIRPTVDQPMIKLDDLAKVSLSPRRPIVDYQARHCEVFVDKIIPFYVFHELSYNGSYSSLDLRFYVKLLLERLDAPVRSVRFYGYDHYEADLQHPDLDMHFAPMKATPWLGSPDYYEFINTNGSGSFRVGAFYVETENGTRYWLNADDRSFGNFVLDDHFVKTAESLFGFYGQKLDRPGHPDGTIWPAPTYIPLDVANVPRTADRLNFANPDGCW